jgi:hypothetical protein
MLGNPKDKRAYLIVDDVCDFIGFLNDNKFLIIKGLNHFVIVTEV